MLKRIGKPIGKPIGNPIGRRMAVAGLLLVGLFTMAPLSVAIAQEGSTATTAAAPPARKPPPGFQQVAGAPDAEKIDASKLVIIAYATFFAGMFGFVVYVSKKQSDIAKEMEALAGRINKAEK